MKGFLFESSVDSIIRPVRKAISQLDNVATRCDAESAQIAEQMEKLFNDRKQTQFEAARARRLRDRLNALLED